MRSGQLGDFDRILEIAEKGIRSLTLRWSQSDQSSEKFDLRSRHANGSAAACEATTTTDQNGIQGVIRDVTELRRSQTQSTARDPAGPLSNAGQNLRLRTKQVAAVTVAVADKAAVPAMPWMP
jgi:hypothetical protein